MSKTELPPVDLHAYTKRIYEVFFKNQNNTANEEAWSSQDEVNLKNWVEEIDYDALNSISPEIERRRAILKYFIPDVFEGGRYDRRMDVIDGAIYYLEYLERTGYERRILDLWATRSGLKSDWMELINVIKDTEGVLLRYHPIWTVIGNLLYPERMIPDLVRHVQVFKGKKRRLDPNDFALISTGIFFSQHPTAQITPKVINFINLLFQETQKIPMEDKIVWKDLMMAHGIKNPRGLQTDINRLNLSIMNLYSREVFGLDSYLYFCPYPTHVRLEHTEGIAKEFFSMNGESNFQEFTVLIPAGGDWQGLLHKFQKVAPDTKCWQITRLRAQLVSPLKYFNVTNQAWDFPWDALTKKWREWVELLDPSDELVVPSPHRIKPNQEFNMVMWLLEKDANLSNYELRRRAKIKASDNEKALDRVKTIRRVLELRALISRFIYFWHLNITDRTKIILPGAEAWKLELLHMVFEVFPAGWVIYYAEDVIDKRQYLIAEAISTPKIAMDFLKAFTSTFKYNLDFTFHKYVSVMNPFTAWIDMFDSKRNIWKWSPDYFQISPLK